jgi:RNA ligase (TIGR02306 family)
MRKMASIRKIDNLLPIEGADFIEVAVIGGWKVVVKKDEFKINDLAVYCEIDSWVPTELAPFLSKDKEPREFNGIKGERLRTVKLRKTLSQGLLLPRHVALDKIGEIFEGQDVSELLGIQKWEMPVPTHLAGMVKGSFPTEIPKTDQERAQNLVKEIESVSNMSFEVTEKLEGSSMTVFQIQGKFGVCSRNLELVEDPKNAFWEIALRKNIKEKMLAVDPNWDFAIQGELVGPSIQGNIYNLSETKFYVFDVYNIQTGEYLKPIDRRNLIDRMGLDHVPFVADVILDKDSVESLLLKAEGKSVLNSKQEREGVVYKEKNGGMTFKTISNKYLINER